MSNAFLEAGNTEEQTITVSLPMSWQEDGHATLMTMGSFKEGSSYPQGNRSTVVRNPGYKVFDADGKVVYEPKAVEPAVKVPFLVKVSISDLNIRKGPGTDYGRVQ